MERRRITLPLTKELAKTLHAGDQVLLTGTIYTSRDAGHKRMCEALAKGENLRQLLQTNYKFSDVVQTPQAVFISENSRGITAQLDDMAQMVGHKAPLAKGFDSSESAGEAILKKMSKHPAILVPGTGIAVRAENAEDLEALKILMHKAVVANIHTSLSGEKKRLSFADSAYMHYVYCKKYSKQKK